MSELALTIDVIPPQAALEAELHPMEALVRFRARRGVSASPLEPADGEPSEWSGWFSIHEEIALTWAAFDFGDGA